MRPNLRVQGIKSKVGVRPNLREMIVAVVGGGRGGGAGVGALPQLKQLALPLRPRQYCRVAALSAPYDKREACAGGTRPFAEVGHEAPMRKPWDE